MSRSRRAASNTSKRPPPSSFARYIATSASRSSSPTALLAAHGERRCPCSRCTRARVPPRRTAPRTRRAAAVRSARSPGRCRCGSRRRRTRRRPSRATMSSSRTQADRRGATWRSSASPAEWPSVSLTTLKRSRSIRSSDSRVPSRAPCRSSRSRWLKSSARLPRPVSGSSSARRRSSSSVAAWSSAPPMHVGDGLDEADVLHPEGDGQTQARAQADVAKARPLRHGHAERAPQPAFKDDRRDGRTGSPATRSLLTTARCGSTV